jgi:hypothetical protein
MCARVSAVRLQPSDIGEPNVFFQIGIEPVRVDIVSSLSGLDFVPAWERKSDG